MLKVGQGHAGSGNLPSMITQISPNQLTQDRVKEKQALKQKSESICAKTKITRFEGKGCPLRFSLLKHGSSGIVAALNCYVPIDCKVAGFNPTWSTIKIYCTVGIRNPD